MKKLFLTLVVAVLTLTATAQETEKQMATLQHGDQTSVFYGVESFKNAYNAAADEGDIIVLSSGYFYNPGTISKSISVYGAGFEDDEATNTKRTFISGSIWLQPADAVDDDGNKIIAGKKVNNCHFEGIYFDSHIDCLYNNWEPIRNLSIVKCSVENIIFTVDSYDCIIRQCVVRGYIRGYSEQFHSNTYANNLQITNCWINGAIERWREESIIYVDHSIMKADGYSNQYTYTNNIIFGNLYSGAVASNNIFINHSYTSDGSTGNYNDLKTAGVFAAEGEDGSYAPEKDFALKYPNKHVGTDGTEIGLHGGVYGWNKIPCIPRITEYQLDTTQAAEGTIKVNIKAEAQTKE